MSKKTVLLILLYVLISVLYLAGIRWGLPNQARYDLVLAPGQQGKPLYERMAQSRELLFDNAAIFTATKSLTKTLAPDMRTLQNGARLIENDERSFPYYMSFARSFLLRTIEPDITNIFNAFAAVHPGKGDFFPDNFMYGLVFVGLYGGILFLLSLLNLVVLSHDVVFYLLHIGELAALYLSLRIFSLIVTGISAFLVYHIMRSRAERFWAHTACLLYLLLPVTIMMTYEVKPHSLALLFLLAGMYMLGRIYARRGQRVPYRLFVMAGAAFACSVGTVPTSLALVGVFCLEAGYMLQVYRKGSGCRGGYGVMLIVLFLLSMGFFVYAFIYPNAFMTEIAKQQRFYPVVWAMAVPSVSLWIQQLLSASSIPFMLCAVTGMIADRRFWVRYVLLAGASAGMFFKFYRIAFALRFSVVIVPVCVIAAIWFLRLIWQRNRWAGALLLVVVFCSTGRAALSTAYDFYVESRPDAPRVRAGQWINAHVPKEAAVGMSKLPTNYNVPPFRLYDHPLYIGPFSVGSLPAGERPAYYILTDRDGSIDARLCETSGWQLVQTFSASTIFLGGHAKKILPYVNPNIYIFKQKAMP